MQIVGREDGAYKAGSNLINFGNILALINLKQGKSSPKSFGTASEWPTTEDALNESRLKLPGQTACMHCVHVCVHADPVRTKAKARRQSVPNLKLNTAGDWD